jgi:hypothetical protein
VPYSTSHFLPHCSFNHCPFTSCHTSHFRATQQSVSMTWTARIFKLSQNLCFLSPSTLVVPPGYIKSSIAGNVRYIWTSGRKCNFNGCNRPDLQPPNVNGWFWSGSGAKIGPTTQRSSGDWSHTGGFGQPQPDNREAPQVKQQQQQFLL